MDDACKDNVFEQKTGLFTVGVVVDRSAVKTAHTGKNYMIMIISDLVRFDSVKLQKHLEASVKDRDKLRVIQKSYSNGYKIVKLMAFGESVKKTTTLDAGTIVAVLNLKKMEPKKDDKPMATDSKKQPSKV
jgi:hypothetical protein